MVENKVNPNTSEIEIAFNILKSNGQEMDFRTLMEETFKQKGITVTPKSLASIYTEMSIDNRFTTSGQGKWGLRDWIKDKSTGRSLSLSSSEQRIYHRLSRKENKRRN